MPDVHKNNLLCRMCIRTQFFVSVHTSARWVKSARPTEPIFFTPTLLIRAMRAMQAEPASFKYIKRNSVCACARMYLRTYVRFYSSKTAGCTIIKLGTIDRHLRVNVTRVFVTSLFIIKDNFF